MVQDVSISQAPSESYVHLAPRTSSRLMYTLPFIYTFSYFGILSENQFSERNECKHEKDRSSESTQQNLKVGSTLLSFCEYLATTTLKQGLREGLGFINGSNHLSVQKPKRRFTLKSFKADSERLYSDNEPNSISFKLSDITEGAQLSCEIQKSSTVSELNSVVSGLNGQSGSNDDFVGLDVLALEKVKQPICYEMSDFACSNTHTQSQMQASRVFDIVRSATDYDIQSKKNRSGSLRVGYDPCSIYDIQEFPVNGNQALTGAARSASIAVCPCPSNDTADSTVVRPEPPPEVACLLEEPLLLVGPKLEWEGVVKSKRISNAKRRKRRQQQMTPQELKKMTRIVIGYTLAFFLLVIITFYIVYFV